MFSYCVTCGTNIDIGEVQCKVCMKNEMDGKGGSTWKPTDAKTPLEEQAISIPDGIHTKDVPGFEGLYFVDITGRVYSHGNRSNHKNIIQLKLGSDKDGYNRVVLSKDAKRTTCRVCRLIATTFIPNPLNLPLVNHIDEDKTNDSVDNLEWVDFYGNWIHSNPDAETPVIQLTRDGDFVAKYTSLMKAARCTGINQGNITNCLKGRCKSVGGFLWKTA